MHRNNLYSETNLLVETVATLRSRLPSGWSLEELGEGVRSWPSAAKIDGALALTARQGDSTTIIVEVKAKPVEARLVSLLLDRW